MTVTAAALPDSLLADIAALEPEGVAARVFDVLDPATGTLLARVADGGAAEATAAVDAAAAAFLSWAATPPRQRSELLRRTFELMLAEADSLAALISAENGKSLADARSEVTYAAEFFRWFAEEAVRPDGGYAESPAGGTRTIVTSRPVGVAALVTPWNFPAAMATRKIGPALAAGCTVVLKPASETPLTALAIARIMDRAGVPTGVVNVVPTTDPATVVGTWLADSRVRKVSFTGSTGVGRQLLTQAADRVVNSSMELGGNAPFVVVGGCRPRRGRAGRVDRQVPQRRPGLHGGQPVLRARLGRVRVRGALRFRRGVIARGQRLRRGHQHRAADQRQGGGLGHRAGHRCPGPRCPGQPPGARPRSGRLLLPADAAGRRTG